MENKKILFFCHPTSYNALLHAVTSKLERLKMNTFFIRLRSMSIVSGVFQVVVEVVGTEGTDSVDGYNFSPSLTAATFNTQLLAAVKGDFGSTGDRFVLLGGGVADIIK